MFPKAHRGRDWEACHSVIAKRTISSHGERHMSVPTPAMVHELAGLVLAVAYLIKTIWPKRPGR